MKTNIFKKILKVVAGMAVALAMVLSNPLVLLHQLSPAGDTENGGGSLYASASSASNPNVGAVAGVSSLQDLLVKTTLTNNGYKNDGTAITDDLTTQDYVWLPKSGSASDLTAIQGMVTNSDAGRMTTATEWALANNSYVYDCCTTSSPYYWLRSAPSASYVHRVYYFGSVVDTYVYSSYVAARPALQLNLASIISARSALGIEIDATAGTIIIPQVKYPQTLVDTTSALATTLNTLGNTDSSTRAVSPSGGMLATGVSYPGYDSSYKEYYYDGNYYVHAKINRYSGSDSLPFAQEQDTATEDPSTHKVTWTTADDLANGKYAWFKVEPIVWHISNLSEILSDINNNNTSTTNTMYVISNQAIVEMGQFYINGSDAYRSMWQNSRLRAYLNGYNLLEENATNGNATYNAALVTNNNANFDFSGPGKGFLQTVWHEAVPAKVIFDPVGGDSFVALQSALNVASVQNVRFASTLTVDNAFVSANGSTIDFKGKTLSGVGINNCLINITTSSDVTIANANFADCPYGAIVSTGTGKLNVQNCTFTNCYVNYEQTVTSTTVVENKAQGGAIKVTGDLKATNCNFVGCYAKASVTATGSGVVATVSNLAQGGAIYAKPASGTANVELTNCTFDGCYAQYSQTLNDSATASKDSVDCGGAVFVEGESTITDCTFTGCYAADGGAINATTTNVKACTFTGCYASSSAGAIRATTLETHNSTFEGCYSQAGGGAVRCTNASVYDTSFYSCRSNSSGGAILAITLNLNNSSFNNCCVTSGNSGAVYCGSLYGDGNKFTNCYAQSYGGAINCSDGILEISNTLFDNCYSQLSQYQGGAISTTNGSYKKIVNCQFYNCYLNNAKNTTDTGYGGAVYVANNSYTSPGACSADVSIVGCVFGKWVDANGDGVVDANENEIFGNKAKYGGACYINTTGNVTIEDSTFVGNDFNYSGEVFFNVNFMGAALYVPSGNGKNLMLSNCVFEHNGYGVISGSDKGIGTLFASGYKTYITNCVFDDCRGGVASALKINGSGNFVMSNTIIKDTTTGYGGLVDVGDFNYLSVSNCSFSGYKNGNHRNDAKTLYRFAGNTEIEFKSNIIFNHDYTSTTASGTCVSLDSVTGTVKKIEGNTFEQNKSFTNVLNVFNSYRVQSYLKDNKFVNNTNKDGGGNIVNVNVYTYNSVTLDGGDRLVVEDCVFEGNSGRALYAGAHINTIKNCTFSNNTLASGNGAAINLPKPTAGSTGLTDPPYLKTSEKNQILNCKFSGNLTSANDSLGGAIYSIENRVDIVSCQFSANQAKSAGGAIRADITNSDNREHCLISISNCQFYANVASNGDGGAVSSTNKSECDGCLFEKNSARKGGAVSMNFAPTFKNCNFYDNYATTEGGAIFSGSSVSLTDCLISNNYAGTNGGGAKGNAFSIKGGTQIINNYCGSSGFGAGVYVSYIGFTLVPSAKAIVINNNFGNAVWDDTNKKVESYDENKPSNVYKVDPYMIGFDSSYFKYGKPNIDVGFSFNNLDIQNHIGDGKDYCFVVHETEWAYSDILECLHPDVTTVEITSGDNAGIYDLVPYYDSAKYMLKIIKQGSDNIEYVASGFYGPYDGWWHTVDVKVVSPDSGYTIKYSNAENGTFSADLVENQTVFKDVTVERTVWFTIEASGKTTVKDSAKVTIIAMPTQIILSSAKLTADFGTSFAVNTSLNGYLTGAFVVDANGNNVAGDFYFSTAQTMSMQSGAIKAFGGNLTFKPSNSNFAAPTAVAASGIAGAVVYTDLWYYDGYFYNTLARAATKSGESITSDTTYRVSKADNGATLTAMLKFLPANATVYFLTAYNVAANETLEIGTNNFVFTKITDTNIVGIIGNTNNIFSIQSGKTLTITTDKFGRLTICGVGTASNNQALIANAGTLTIDGNVVISANNTTGNASLKGAGISGGTVNLTGVTLTGLVAADCAAIYASGNLSLTDVVVNNCTTNANNSIVCTNGTATINYSTISGNSGNNRNDVLINGGGSDVVHAINGSNMDSVYFASSAGGTINLSGNVQIPKMSYYFYESSTSGFAVYNVGLTAASRIKLNATNSTVVGTYALRTAVYSLDGIYGKIFSLLNSGTGIGGLGISGGFMVVLATSSSSTEDEEDEEDEYLRVLPTGLQEVEYIERSSGTITLNANFNPQTDIFELVYSSNEFFWWPYGMWTSSNCSVFTINGASQYYSNFNVSSKTRLTFGKSRIRLENLSSGAQTGTSNSAWGTQTSSSFEFLSGNYYGFKVWSNEILVHNLVPCVVKADQTFTDSTDTTYNENKVGFYDVLTGIFYCGSGFSASATTGFYEEIYWDPANTSTNADDANNGSQYAPVLSLDKAVKLAKQYGAVVKQLSTLTVSTETTLDFKNVVLGRASGFTGDHLSVSTTDAVTVNNVRVDGNYTTVGDLFAYKISTVAGANVTLNNFKMDTLTYGGIKFAGDSTTKTAVLNINNAKINSRCNSMSDNDEKRCININNTETVTLTNCDLSGSAQIYCSDGTLNINNCNLHDNCFGSGTQAVPGGAVRAATVVAKNCKFINNKTSKSGGAIYASSVNATNCTFSDGTVGYNVHGAGICSSGNVVVENCRFENLACSTSGDTHGGAISANGTVTAKSCQFIKTAAYQGGGIFAGGDVYLENCDFDKIFKFYSATNHWGAAFVHAGSNKITAINCTFTDSWAGKSIFQCGAMVMDNCIISGCSNGTSYGSCSIQCSSIEATNCTFIDNNCTINEKGIIYCTGNVTLTNCDISRNTTRDTIIFADNASANVVIKDTKINNNTVTGQDIGQNGSTNWVLNFAGGVYVAGTANITNSEICNNSATRKMTVNNNSGVEINCVGGLFVRGETTLSNVKINNNAFSSTNMNVHDNTTKTEINTIGGLLVKNTLTLSNVEINNNTVNVTETLTNNASQSYTEVGGLRSTSTATLTNVEICHNTSTNGIGGLSTGGGTWLNVTVGYNTGYTYGVGITSATQITNSNFCYNTVTRNTSESMSGLHLNAGSTFTNCNFFGNKNGNCCGVHYSWSGNGTFYNCSFYDNYTTSGHNYGGCIIATNGDLLKMYNCKIYNNISTNMNTIGVANQSAYFYNTEFYNNSTSGSYVVGNNYNCSTVWFENCSLHNNKGRIINSYTNANNLLTMINTSVFANNDTNENNYSISLSKANIDNCQFYNNTKNGSNPFIRGETGDFSVTNCRFYNNRATLINRAGGVITNFSNNYISGNTGEYIVSVSGTVTNFENNVFANNKLTSNSYGVVYMPTGSTVKGCVFYGNTNVSTGADSPIILVGSGRTVTFDSCLFYENASLGTSATANKVFKFVGEANFNACQFANNYYYDSNLSTTKKLAIASVYVDGGVATIDGCVFTLNPSTDLPFGNYGVFYVNSGELNIYGKFEKLALGEANLVVVDGGVANVYAQILSNTVSVAIIKQSGGELNLKGTIISGNTATAGSIIEQLGGDLNIQSATISNNTSSQGSVIDAIGGDFSATGSTIANNTASAGAILKTGAGVAKISACTISGNTTQSGTIYTGGMLNLKQNTIANNTGVNGGAICVGNGGVCVLESGTLASNTATSGGAIYVENGGLFTLLAGVVGETNTASGTNTSEGGGAIYVAEGGKAVINGGEVVGNTAKYGAGIYNNGTLVVNDGKFWKNKISVASGMGGGIYNSGLATINYVQLSANNYISTSSQTIYGLALANSGKLNMLGGIVENNSFDACSGAVYCNEGTANISGVTFDNNANYFGSAINVKATATAKIANCTFNLPTSYRHPSGGNGRGAGLYLEGNFEVENCHFSGTGTSNTKYNGAVYIINTASGKMTDCTFEDIFFNGCSAFAGTVGAGKTVEIVDCTISGCRKDGTDSSSNVLQADGEVIIDNLHYVNNYGTNYAGFNLRGSGSVVIRNSLFEGNYTTATNDNVEFVCALALGGTATKLVDNCVFKNNNNSSRSVSTLYISNTAQDVTIKDCTFENNTCYSVIYTKTASGTAGSLKFVGNNTIENNNVKRKAIDFVNESTSGFGIELGFGGKLYIYDNKNAGGAQVNFGGFDNLINNGTYNARVLIGGLANGSKIGLTIDDNAKEDLFVGTNPISSSDFACFVSDSADYVIYLDSKNNKIKYSTIASATVVASGEVVFADGYYHGLTNSNFQVYDSGTLLDQTDFVVTYSTQEDGIYTLVSPQYAWVAQNTVYYRVYKTADYEADPDSAPYASGSTKVVVAQRYLSALVLPKARADVGATLATVLIFGGEVVDNFGSPVAGTWAFADGTAIATNGGKFDVTFTPSVAGVYANEGGILGAISVEYKFDLLRYKVDEDDSSKTAFYSGATKTNLETLQQAMPLVANGGRIVFDTNYKFVSSESVTTSGTVYICKGVDLRGNMFVVSDEMENLAVTFSGNIVFDGAWVEGINLNKELILPKTFQQVEYLEGTGTQYIENIWDIGDHTIEFDIMPIDMSGGFSNWLFGLYDTSGIGLDPWTYGITISNSTLTQVYAGTVTPTRAAEGVREKYTFVTRAGAYSTEKLGLFFETGYYDRIFKGRVYSFKVKRTSDDELIRDLIPCYRKSDNVIGMYDIINDVFYTNSGIGTFTKGPNVGSHNWGVAYDDRTQEVLDAGLLPVDYIESNGTQYIDTGYVPKSDTIVEISFEKTSNRTQYDQIFGRFDDTNTKFYLEFYGGHMYQQIGNGSYTYSNAQLNTRYDVTISTKKFTVNGTEKTGNLTFTQNSSTLHLFGRNGTNTNNTQYNAAMKLYYFRVYEGTTLVKDLAPAYNPSTGKAGLYDYVSKAFMTSANSADLSYGSVTLANFAGATTTTTSSYLAINGNNNYIDTGIKFNDTSKIEITFSGTTGGQGNGMVLTGNTGTSSSDHSGYINASGWGYSDFNSNGTRTGENIGSFAQVFDGTKKTITFSGYRHSNNSAKICTGYWVDSYYGREMYWYNMKIWNTSGDLIRNYYPTVSGGQGGFCDLITGEIRLCTGTADVANSYIVPEHTYSRINLNEGYNGSGLFRVKEGSTLNLEGGVRFENWNRTDGYSFIYNQGTLNINGASFVGNSVTSNGTDDVYGGLVLNTGTVNINSGTFVNNKVEGSGMAFGGIVCNAGGTVNINGGTFVDNKISATNGGHGAVVFNTNGGTTSVFGGEFVRNSANYGGVVANGTGTLVFAGGTTSMNVATVSNGGAVVNGTNVDGISSIIYLGGEMVANSILANGQPIPQKTNVEIAGTNHALWACIVALLGAVIAFVFWRVLELSKRKN